MPWCRTETLRGESRTMAGRSRSPSDRPLVSHTEAPSRLHNTCPAGGEAGGKKSRPHRPMCQSHVEGEGFMPSPQCTHLERDLASKATV